MTIARIAAPTLTEQGTGGTTSFVVSMPATVNIGELLVMAVGASGGVVSTPAGWTLIGGGNQAAADSCYGFYKVALGTEGGTTVTVTLGASGRATAFVTRYSGVDTSTPLDVAATTGQNTGVGSTCVIASLTTVTNNAFLVTAAAGNAAVGLSWTQPGGFVTPTTSTGTGKGAAYSDGVTVSPAAATGTATWTWSSSGLQMNGWMAALRPAAPPAGLQFLTNAFGAARAAYEIAFGADITAAAGTWTWTDVTSDVMNTTQTRVTQGRADETTTAQPASCSFALNNSTGKYTPFSPTASLYPNVKKGTPVRVRVDFGSGFQVVFFGFAAGFTPVWDNSARLATVSVAASGLLRRLGRLSTPLRSALFRTIQATNPVAHWPMEDGSGSSRATSAVSGGPALMPIGAGVTFGAAGPGGSEASVDFSPGGSLSGQGPNMSGDFEITFAYRLTTTASASMPLQFNTSDGSTWQVIVDPTGTPSISLNGSIGGAPFSSLSTARATNDLGWHAVEVTFKTNGANIDITVGWDGLLATFGAVLTGTVPRVGSITVGPSFPSGSHAFFLTQLAVIPQPGSVIAGLASAVSGFTGETASARFSRICTEEGVAATVTGTSTALMGSQPTSALLDVLNECEVADGGLIIDGLDAGLRFVTTPTRVNLTAALTIDASAGQLSPPFAPVDDDQRTLNDATANRPNGGTARYVQTTGDLGTATVGTYDTSITANVSSDDRLIGIAGWAVNLGTIPGLRYPTLPLDFVAVPALAGTWLAAGSPGGFRIDITNVTSKATQAPPDTVALMVEGWDLMFDTVTFSGQVNCSPYEPWRVAVYGTARYDSQTSTLSAGVASGATSFSVATTGSPLWTTGSVSFALNVGGEKVTVTNISGASSPQTFTVTRSVNGVVKAQTSGTAVRLWDTPRYGH